MSKSPSYHCYSLRVAFHETDAMGVVHHSVYVKWFEEARVAWLRDREMMQHHYPYGAFIFAVIRMQNAFYKPAKFDDELVVWTQANAKGLRIHFQYALFSPQLNQVIAEGKTELVAITDKFKPVKLPPEMLQHFENEPWSEVWPPKGLSKNK